MKLDTKKYPDISDILQRKAEGRRELANRSFGEKLDALDALRDRAAPLRAAKDKYETGPSIRAVGR